MEGRACEGTEGADNGYPAKTSLWILKGRGTTTYMQCTKVDTVLLVYMCRRLYVEGIRIQVFNLEKEPPQMADAWGIKVKVSSCKVRGAYCGPISKHTAGYTW